MEGKLPLVRKIEEGICYFFICLLALVPAAEAFARLFFRTGVPASVDLTIHFLLVLGLMSGMITTGKKEHLTIVITGYFLNEKIKKILDIIASQISVFIAVILAWCGASFVKIAL